MKKKEIVEIWTDGSCNYRNGLGGIGVYMKYGKLEKKIRIGYKNTKIGRMELKAVIIALRAIKNKNYHFVIYSDSQYIVKSINLWMIKWIHNGWIGIKNTDLWAQFIFEYKQFNINKIRFIHIKGHTGKQNRLALGNEIADELAFYRKQRIVHESDLFLDEKWEKNGK